MSHICFVLLNVLNKNRYRRNCSVILFFTYSSVRDVVKAKALNNNILVHLCPGIRALTLFLKH